jgi:asparagine synthase (glutamine-hydrolysing)
LLPPEIIHRRKMGFPTPLRGWLMDPKAEPLLQALQARDGLLSAHVRGEELRGLIDRHRSGVIDATDRLWRLLNLQIWGDVFLNGKRERWDGLVSRPRMAATPA